MFQIVGILCLVFTEMVLYIHGLLFYYFGLLDGLLPANISGKDQNLVKKTN